MTATRTIENTFRRTIAVLLVGLFLVPASVFAAEGKSADEALHHLPQYGPDNPDETYVPHAYEEHQYDIGEITINYAVTGRSENPAIVLIPGQKCSWWAYEEAMGVLEKEFQVYAVDLRGQGRSSRTPGRYTFDNMGNDLVRFIAFVVKRPIIVSGNSSGGVIAAWLSAYAPPGMLRGAVYEDPPLFSCEISPAVGPPIRQLGDHMEFWNLMNRSLGDQWKTGDWASFVEAVGWDIAPPPQNFKEYDPEWARAFYEGTVSASCDHWQMLSQVKCPVLFTHHYRAAPTLVDGRQTYRGAISDEQAQAVQQLVEATGQPMTYRSFPEMSHQMYRADPELFASLILEWEKTLPSEGEVRQRGVFQQ